MEREPDAPLEADEDVDLFGDPAEVDHSIEEDDERLQEERDDDV
jgi:hypothetical protein